MKKLWKWSRKILFVLMVGSGGALLAIYYLFPLLGIKTLKDNVTVINKTEELVVREDNQLNRIASQGANSVVFITSIQGAVSKFGTGIVLTSDGLVVAFRGAILEKGARYNLVLSNGQAYEASLEGIDEFTDLAFLKVDANNLTSVSFANSDDYYPGKKMILVAPSIEEFQGRFSGAILSGLNRNFNIAGEALSNSRKLEGVFDLDASNPKDFLGCAVIDYNGELGGILGSVRMDNQEKFFIIPVNEVRKSLDLAVRKELGTRPNPGAYYLSLDKSKAIIYNSKLDSGAMIYSFSGKQGLAVIANSPADKAGLKIGDIITMVNNDKVDLKNPLSNLIGKYKRGEAITLTILRNNTEQKIKVNL